LLPSSLSTVLITNGGTAVLNTISTIQALDIGYSTNISPAASYSYGTVIITNGGVLTVSNAIVGYANGDAGPSTLSISGNGTLIASNVTIANQYGSYGILNVGTYGGSSTNVTLGAATVTFGGGLGTLNFNQSDILTNSSVFMGGTNISGANSGGSPVIAQLGSGTTVLTGRGGTNGASIVVDNGQLVVNNGSFTGIRVNPSSYGNSYLYVGVQGLGIIRRTGAATNNYSNSTPVSMIITNGGVVNEQNVFVGLGDGSTLKNSNNWLLVNGSNSSLTGANISIGNEGNNNSLIVTNKATVTCTITLDIGDEGNGNTAIITGTNSSLNVMHNLGVGYSYSTNNANFGNSNSLIISNGASVTVGTGLYIGQYYGYGNSVLVTGTNSSLSNSSIYLGEYQGGCLGGQNTLTVSSGAHLYGSNDIIADAGGNSNAIIITGAGSLYSNSGKLTIGNSANYNYDYSTGDADYNRLVVSNGATAIIGSGGLTVGIQDSQYASGNALSNSLTVTGPDSALTINGGGLTIGNGYVTNGSGSYTVSGNAVLVDSNAVLTLSGGDTYVGYGVVSNNALSNSLTVSGGATANLGGGIYMGYTAGDNGNSIVVTGAGSILTNGGGIYVGYSGNSNSLNISGGGVFNESHVLAIEGTGIASNTLIISDPGSILNVSGRPSQYAFVSSWVGTYASNDSLIIRNGAAANLQGGLEIGESGSRNSVLVTSNAVLTVTGQTIIGYNDYLPSISNALTVSGGGTATLSGNTYIGYTNGDIGNSILVTGTNSTLSNSGNLYVGNNGASSNTVTVYGNSTLTVSSNTYIGFGGASSNTVLVTGTNALWTNGTNVYIGYGNGSGSKGNNLVISNAGTVSSLGYFQVGYTNGDSGNSVKVTGTNSRLVIDGSYEAYFDIGYQSDSNSMIVSNGAQVILNNSVNVGHGSADYPHTVGSSGNTLIVTGPGTLLSNSGRYLDIGRCTNSTGNLMVVSNQATVYNTNILYIGYDTASASNTVIITDTNTKLINGGELYVGVCGSGNSLIISNGATASIVGVSYIGFNAVASNNRLIVTGTNSVMSNTEIDLGDYGSGNTLVISNGGRVTASSSGSYVSYYAGSSNNSVLITGAGSLWSNSSIDLAHNGSGSITVASGGTILASGTITIANGSGTAGALTLSQGTVNAACLIVNSNGVLTGNGTITTTADPLFDGGTYAPTGTNAMVINGNVTFTNSAVYLWNLFANSTNNTGGTNFTVTSILNNGSLTVTGSTFSVNFGTNVTSGGAFWNQNEQWTIMTGTNVGSGTNFSLIFTGNTNGLNLANFSLITNAGQLDLLYSLPSLLTYNWATNSGNWTNTNCWSSNAVPGVSNTATLDYGNARALLTNSGLSVGSLIIGSNTSGNSLMISNGGSLSVASNTVIGGGANSSNALLTVAGLGSALTCGGDLYVGSNGPNATLAINNGATVTAPNTHIGYGATSSNNLLAIDGGTLTNTGFLKVGDGGSGTLSLNNGAHVYATNLTVAANSTLEGNGTITAPVTVNGGTVTPTGSNTLAINGNLSFSNSAIYQWTLFNNSTSNPGVNYTEPLALNGSLSVTTGSVFNMLFTNSVSSTNSFWTPGVTNSWVVMTGSNVSAGTNFVIGFAPGSISSGFILSDFYWTTNANQLVLNYYAIPGYTNNSGTNSLPTNNGNVAVNGGTLAIQGSGTTTISNLLITSGTVATGSNATVSVNTFTNFGGAITGGTNATFWAANYYFAATNLASVDANLANLGTITNYHSTAIVTTNANGAPVAPVVFQNSMSYDGGTVITAGILQLGSSNSTGPVTIQGVITNNGYLNYGYNGSSTTPTNLVIGSGVIGQVGTGTLTVGSVGVDSQFTGSFAAANGTIAITTNSALGSATNYYLSSNGTLQATTGVTTITNTIQVTNGSGIVENSNGGILALNGKLTKSGTVLVLAGGAFDVNGQVTGSGAPGSFDSDLVISNATVTLNNGNNNYSGPTTVQAGSSLTNGIANALPTNTVLTMGAISDGAVTNRYEMAGRNQTIAALASAGSASNIISSESTANLTLNGAQSTTYSGSITGAVALTRSGTGAITLTQNNTYAGGTTINSGKIVTTASRSLGTGTMALNGGTLEVRSLLNIGAMTWSGGKVALPTLTSLNGIYVVSTGGLTLNNSAHVFDLTGASLTIGTATPLLGATNMTYGNFSTNEFSVEGVSRYALTISNDILWIDLLGNPVPPAPTYPNFVIPGLTYNQTQVAQALNVWASNNPTGDKTSVLSALTNIPTNQWAAAYDQMSPRFYQQMATISFNLANAQYNELVQRLYGLRVAGTGFSMTGFDENTAMPQENPGKSVVDPKKDILRPGLDNRWGMFVDGNGIFANANSANMLPGYNFESGGITTGLTYKWNDSVGTGIYAGYQGAYSKNNGLGTLIDNAVKFGLFGAYGTPDGKGLYADGLIGGGYNNYQNSRSIQFGSINRTANSSPGAGELDSMLAAGYNWRKGNWSFGPVGSLQYTYFGVNSFNETGAQSLNLNNQGWNASSMLSSVGANCAYSWEANRNLMVVPQINLAWQHEFLQNPYAINSTMGGTPYSNWSAVPNRDTLYTGVGVTMEYKKTWNTAFFYNAAAGNQNLESQNIFWSAGVKF